MKIPKYHFYTIDMLKDKLNTKIALRDTAADKVIRYNIEISEIEKELIRRKA
jgi:hypothetical protein